MNMTVFNCCLFFISSSQNVGINMIQKGSGHDKDLGRRNGLTHIFLVVKLNRNKYDSKRYKKYS